MNRRLLLRIVACCAAAFSLVAVVFVSRHIPLAHADNTAYYVSSSGGNDNNDGRSSSTPWQTLTKASSVTLSPGDQLLLKSGDVWTGQTLAPQGSGTPSNPILITSYGNGNRPYIKPGIGVQTYAIHLVNNDGYKITNLEISDTYGGVVAYDPTTSGHDYLWVENCYFHDITGKDTGFNTSGAPNYTPPASDLHFGTGVALGGNYDGTHTLYSDITLTNDTFYHDDAGFDQVYGTGTQQSRAWWQNININNSSFTQMYRTGAIILYSTTGGTTDHVTVDSVGYQVGMFWGNAGIQMFRVANYTIQNSEMKHAQRANNTPDGEGFDFEGWDDNVTLRNSSIHDNVGPAILFNNNGGTNSNCTIDGVTMTNNNSTNYGGNTVFYASATAGTGDIRNSTIYLTNDQQSYAAPSGWTFESSNTIYNVEGTVVSGNSPSGGVTPVDDSVQGTGNKQFNYVGSGWGHCTNCDSTQIGRYDESNSWDSTAQDYFTFQFTGTGVIAYFVKTPDSGNADLSLDGGTSTKVDLGSGTYAGNQPAYSVENLSNTTHTLKVVVDGTGDSGASPYNVIPDRVDVLTTTLTPVDDSAQGTGNNQFNYSGSGWGHCTGCDSDHIGRYNGSNSWDDTPGDSFTFQFTGTGAIAYFVKTGNSGYVDISLDGGPASTVDLSLGTAAGNQPTYVVENLTNTTHTLKVVVDGTGDSGTSPYYVIADRMDVMP